MLRPQESPSNDVLQGLGPGAAALETCNRAAPTAANGSPSAQGDGDGPVILAAPKGG
jgi:hypothetical protein